jgi:hypothetical protein
LVGRAEGGARSNLAGRRRRLEVEVGLDDFIVKLSSSGVGSRVFLVDVVHGRR